MAAAHGAPMLASVVGVVVGISTPGIAAAARRLTCPFCGAGGARDVAAGVVTLPCCGTRVELARERPEDVAHRTIVRSRSLWLRALTSRAGSGGGDGGGGGGCGAAGNATLPVQVVVAGTDELVDAAALGDAVEVVGFASQAGGGSANGSGGTPEQQAAGCVQIEARRVARVAPAALWAPLPAAGPGAALELLNEERRAGAAPLQGLLDLFDAATGCDADPHLALALLLSAATSAAAARGDAESAGAEHKSQPGAPSQASQRARPVNVLAVHEDRGAPQTLRLLRAAAAVLSPQVALLPAALAEQVAPIVAQQRGAVAGGGGGAAGGGAVVYASALTAANAGVAVVDAGAMSKRALKQLAEALPRRALPAPGAPGVVVPMAAAVWAACGESDVAPGDLSAPGAAAAAARRGGFGGAGFDFVLRDEADEGERQAGVWVGWGVVFCTVCCMAGCELPRLFCMLSECCHLPLHLSLPHNNNDNSPAPVGQRGRGRPVLVARRCNRRAARRDGARGRAPAAAARPRRARAAGAVRVRAAAVHAAARRAAAARAARGARARRARVRGAEGRAARGGGARRDARGAARRPQRRSAGRVCMRVCLRCVWRPQPCT